MRGRSATNAVCCRSTKRCRRRRQASPSSSHEGPEHKRNGRALEVRDERIPRQALQRAWPFSVRHIEADWKQDERLRFLALRGTGRPGPPFEEARLKAIKEKKRKYRRRPFSGADEEKAYLIGLRHGDLSVCRPFGDAIRVSTSTIHPAMANLFRELFETYGYVYQHPRFKRDTQSYEWNLEVILDSSFDFLLEDREAGWRWVSRNKRRILAYLAGLVDAEGCISIYRDKRNTALLIAFYNTDLRLISLVAKLIRALSYHVLGPYLDKPRGFTSLGYRIEMKRDYHRVVLAGFKEAQGILDAFDLCTRKKRQKDRLRSPCALDSHRIR